MIYVFTRLMFNNYSSEKKEIKKIVRKAMNEFEINDSLSRDRIASYAKHFGFPGYYLPSVLPFLLRCMDYAKREQDLEVENITYKSLEWGVGWYAPSSQKEEYQKVTFEDYKNILVLTSDRKKLMYELVYSLELTQLKKDLIKGGYINIPMKNKDSDKKICISKSKPNGAESCGELCTVMNDNEENHKKKHVFVIVHAKNAGILCVPHNFFRDLDSSATIPLKKESHLSLESDATFGQEKESG